MVKKQRESANDKPQSSPQPRPSQQSVASKSSSNVLQMPYQSAGHDASGIRLPSITNQPYSPSGSSPISYHAVPPPGSLNSGSPRYRTQKATAKHSTANPPFEPPNIKGFQTSHITDTPFLIPIESSVSLPVLAKTPEIDACFSSELNIGTSSTISVSIRTSDYNLEYMERLQSFIASKTALEEMGYVLQPLSESAIERKKRCERCGKSKFTRLRVVDSY